MPSRVVETRDSRQGGGCFPLASFCLARNAGEGLSRGGGMLLSGSWRRARAAVGMAAGRPPEVVACEGEVGRREDEDGRPLEVLAGEGQVGRREEEDRLAAGGPRRRVGGRPATGGPCRRGGGRPTAGGPRRRGGRGGGRPARDGGRPAARGPRRRVGGRPAAGVLAGEEDVLLVRRRGEPAGEGEAGRSLEVVAGKEEDGRPPEVDVGLLFPAEEDGGATVSSSFCPSEKRLVGSCAAVEK